MHVALFHPAKLPVRRYGGVDRVVVWLARGLAELGHTVSLLAAPGSEVPEARLVAVPPGPAGKPGFDLARHLPAGVDIIHSHRPISRPAGNLPLVWTHHGNSRPEQLDDLPSGMICLSANHATRHRTNAFVYNGVDLADYRFGVPKAEHDLFLGRLHTSRGYAWALEGARRTGHPLVVAGGWRPSLRRDLRYVGEVGDAEKVELLAEARCLWVPAQWDEPFGLPPIEAMASGTPVLGTLRGALPELVSAETGALGETLEDLVELRPRLDQVEPEACRARAEQWFSHRVMAEAYLRCYEAVLRTGVLPPGRVAGG
jgi:glycosyltransferase involved in cell wall biosynthesis